MDDEEREGGVMKFIIYRVSDGWDINKQPHSSASITKVVQKYQRGVTYGFLR